MTRIAVFDTKPYDRDFLAPHASAGMEWIFIETRLNASTAVLAKGCAAACLFVNDDASAEALAQLKAGGTGMLALRCAGYNNVDLKAAALMGFRITRVPAYSPHAVAEHALALLLCLNRKIHRAHLRVMEHDFSLQGLLGWDLFGKTVGIVGAGRVGKIAAAIFRGFGCRVLAADPVPDTDWARANGVSYTSLDKLLAESDVVSLHSPLTKESFHLVDQRRLGLMKPGAYLINTGRGKLVDSKVLVDFLKQGRLGGVALDVYEEEEGIFFENLSNQILTDDVLVRLLSFPNVLITSHQAFFTQEAMHEIAAMTAQNLNLYLAGRPALEGSSLPLGSPA
jgi:D-lactate dehydrogenase